MEENRLTADVLTAVLASSVASNLCSSAGIISIDDKGVHLAEFFFHQIFSTWYTEPCNEDFEYHVHKVNGVRVFTLVLKSGKEDEG